MEKRSFYIVFLSLVLNTTIVVAQSTYFHNTAIATNDIGGHWVIQPLSLSIKVLNTGKSLKALCSDEENNFGYKRNELIADIVSLDGTKYSFTFYNKYGDQPSTEMLLHFSNDKMFTSDGAVFMIKEQASETKVVQNNYSFKTNNSPATNYNHSYSLRPVEQRASQYFSSSGQEIKPQKNKKWIGKMIEGAKDVLSVATAVSSTINTINHLSDVSNGLTYVDAINKYNPIQSGFDINSIASQFGQGNISNDLISQLIPQHQNPSNKEQNNFLLSAFLQGLIKNENQQTNFEDHWKLKEKYASEQAAQFEEVYGKFVNATFPYRNN